MYACMYACMDVCVCVRVCVCIYPSTYRCIYTYTRAHTPIYGLRFPTSICGTLFSPRSSTLFSLTALTQHSNSPHPPLYPLYPLCLALSPQGFELLGFDIMIDDDLIPWLIEVNASPALATESSLDCQIKEALIGDTLDILQIKPQAPVKTTSSTRSSLLSSVSTSSAPPAHLTPAAAAAAASAAGLPPAAAAAAAATAAQAAPSRVSSRLPLLANRPPSASSCASNVSATTSVVSAASTAVATPGGGAAGQGGAGHAPNAGESGVGKTATAKERAGGSGSTSSAVSKPGVRPPFGGGGGRDARSMQRVPLPPSGSSAEGAGVGGEGEARGGGAAWAKPGGVRKAASRSASLGSVASKFGARRLGVAGAEREGQEGDASERRTSPGLSLERGGKVRVGGAPVVRASPAGGGVGVGRPPVIPRSVSASEARRVSSGPGAGKGGSSASSQPSSLSSTLDCMRRQQGWDHRQQLSKKEEEEEEGKRGGEGELGEDAEEEAAFRGDEEEREEEAGEEGTESPASDHSARAADTNARAGQDVKAAAAAPGGARSARRPPLGAPTASNASTVSGATAARPRVASAGRVGGSAVQRGACALLADGRDAEERDVICKTKGAGGTSAVDKAEARKEGGGAGATTGGAHWDNRGPAFGEKIAPGANGFRLVFPFDEESCQLAGVAERKAGHKGNVDIRPLIELVKQSEAKFRKDVRAAGKKLVNAALSESAPGGDRTAGGMPGVLGLRRSGAKPSAEPWWMAPGPSHRTTPSPLVS